MGKGYQATVFSLQSNIVSRSFQRVLKAKSPDFGWMGVGYPAVIYFEQAQQGDCRLPALRMKYGWGCFNPDEPVFILAQMNGNLAWAIRFFRSCLPQVKFMIAKTAHNKT